MLLPAAGERTASAMGALSLRDDAYHLVDWQDGRNDAFFTEWWYFNFTDSSTGLRAIFTYLVFDPDDLSGLGRSQLTSVVYTPDGAESLNETYPVGDFQASYERADVTIGAESSVRVDAGGDYRVRGATRNGRLRWDLTYQRRAEPWMGLEKEQVGVLPWERMSWLVYMPSADVRGSLVVDGREYRISAHGYHDHNWGEWVFTNALWNWGQYSQPGLTLELGDFIGKQSGVLAVDFDGRRTVFEKGEYFLAHSRWQWDAANALRYPQESWLYAQNDDTRVLLRLQALDTVALRADVPFPIPDPVIYEQVARYSGWLSRREGEGWRTVAIEGEAFKEYTANAWP